MTMFEFSIIASGLDPEADDFETRFYEAGCDDALVSFQRGRIIIDFAREAGSIEEAISTAAECVTKAGAMIDRIEPDPLVSLADIAARTGMTRAAMTHYSKGQRGGGDFPAPVARVTSESPLWNWASVACWLFRNRKISREKTLEALVVEAANDAIEAGEIPMGAVLHERARECEARL